MTRNAVAPRFLPQDIARDFNTEVWLGLPKDKTLGGLDQVLLTKAGYTMWDKRNRIPDYSVVSGMREPTGIGVRVFELRPKTALKRVAENKLDLAIVGRDVLSEFMTSNQIILPEVLDLNIKTCLLTIAVPEDDTAKTKEDLNNRYIVVDKKYAKTLRQWAEINNIKFAGIIEEEGDIESYIAFDKRVNAICDIVDSGTSLIANGWRPLGITEKNWDKVRFEELSYSQLPKADLDVMPGTVLCSTAVMVQARKIADNKIAAVTRVIDNTEGASGKLGYTPTRSATYKMGLSIAA